MKKRLLASVLAALMVVGMMPEAFAADGTNERTDASVAETGGVYYNSLDTAIKNVSANGTVTLLKDTTTNAKYITVETPLTLDLGGNVLTAEQSGFDVYTNFTIKNGTVNTNRWGVWLQDESTEFTL